MKDALLFVLIVLTASNANAQHFEVAQHAGKTQGGIFAIPRDIAHEVATSTRDFVAFRDMHWQILTFAQIGAASADAKTSLNNFGRCETCRETGLARFVIGSRPSAKKYIVAGFVEIAVEAVAGHYLRRRASTGKWYWRAVWALPQSFSFYAHTRAAIRNANIHLHCDPVGQHCY